MKKVILSLLLTLGFTQVSVAVEGSVEAGKTKSAACALTTSAVFEAMRIILICYCRQAYSRRAGREARSAYQLITFCYSGFLSGWVFRDNSGA